jgi:hypothetical protein
MGFTITSIIVILALLVCLTATYNAYLLRGGKMALSQVYVALGMVVLVFSLALANMGLDYAIFSDLKASELLFMGGFLLLLLGSLRVRSSLK